jgi:hypothetical protein
LLANELFELLYLLLFAVVRRRRIEQVRRLLKNRLSIYRLDFDGRVIDRIFRKVMPPRKNPRGVHFKPALTLLQ